MAKRKTIGEFAAEHCRETDNPGIMYGDHGLAHDIAERAGIGHNGWRTYENVLRAVERSPLFKKHMVRIPGGRLVRCFYLVKKPRGRG